MRESDCIFCKLANGEIPTNTLYEDEFFRVIFDLSPVSKGHALIIPKCHFKDIYDIEEDILSKAAILAKKMVKVMKAEFNADGFNIIQNNEVDAGQTVFHFHIHLIPRYKGDKAIKFGESKESNAKELKSMTEIIRRAMESQQ